MALLGFSWSRTGEAGAEDGFPERHSRVWGGRLEVRTARLHRSGEGSIHATNLTYLAVENATAVYCILVVRDKCFIL